MQKKSHSFLEALINYAIGYAVAMGLQIVLYPFYGVHLEVGTQAEMAGFTVDSKGFTDDDLEQEIVLAHCPDEGIQNDITEEPEHYRIVAFFSEYPEEGTFGLGEQIKKDQEGSK